MRIHLIAIGGSAMHNMAIALHKKGYKVTGSDDEIFEPSKSRLDAHGLLPEKMGWDENNINDSIDIVILGMHARPDNPELLKAQEIGLKVVSYPEYIYEQTKDKKRIVIAGSHGKTSITSMVLHVLNHYNMPFDYMVGAQLEGFDTMVRLTKESPIVILEGDEYLSSPIDRRPKFMHYKPDVALISGIAWDHINVFPTFEGYVDQFKQLVDTVPSTGTLISFDGDENVVKVSKDTVAGLKYYNTHPFRIEEGKTYIKAEDKEYQLRIFGKHNLQNLNGARLICESLDISSDQFYEAITTFNGAAKRLEWVAGNDTCDAYKDFAHSPSKLKATTNAVKEQFPNRTLIACMELHTFSSLNAEFLKEYAGAMDKADVPIVFFSRKAIEHKKLSQISEEEVKSAFKNDRVQIVTETEELQAILHMQDYSNTSLLLMSSGNFDGINVNEFAKELVN